MTGFLEDNKSKFIPIDEDLNLIQSLLIIEFFQFEKRSNTFKGKHSASVIWRKGDLAIISICTNY